MDWSIQTQNEGIFLLKDKTIQKFQFWDHPTTKQGYQFRFQKDSFMGRNTGFAYCGVCIQTPTKN